jgi:flagellar hook assembly protein FlgD
LIVYDVQGRVVRTLLDEEATAGVHEVAWDGSDQAGIPANSGVYLVRMEAREFRSTRKLLLAR